VTLWPISANNDILTQPVTSKENIQVLAISTSSLLRDPGKTMKKVKGKRKKCAALTVAENGRRRNESYSFLVNIMIKGL
jgi:hypothetical protein